MPSSYQEPRRHQLGAEKAHPVAPTPSVCPLRMGLCPEHTPRPHRVPKVLQGKDPGSGFSKDPVPVCLGLQLPQLPETFSVSPSILHSFLRQGDPLCPLLFPTLSQTQPLTSWGWLRLPRAQLGDPAKWLELPTKRCARLPLGGGEQPGPPPSGEDLLPSCSQVLGAGDLLSKVTHSQAHI